jgi:hypothetical protein
MESIAHPQSAKLLTASNVGVSLLAGAELAWSVWIGLRYRTEISGFASIFLLIGAAGITVSWFRYFDAYKEGISNKSLSAIVTLYMTVGFMIETLAYALKGR